MFLDVLIVGQKLIDVDQQNQTFRALFYFNLSIIGWRLKAICLIKKMQSCILKSKAYDLYEQIFVLWELDIKTTFVLQGRDVN